MIYQVALVVRDYDEAIAYFTKTLGFDLVEDTPQLGKRWVLVKPPGSDVALLLARAANPAQESRIGNQTGGRVFLFLGTTDFWADYNAFKAHGVRFVEEPRSEAYGMVVVFEDLYGNKWDLVEQREPRRMSLPLEVERKYLLRALPTMPTATDVLEIDQGYLPGVKLLERLRRQVSRDGVTRYFRTVKLGMGVERMELEDETDAATFDHMWLLTEGRRLRKRRHVVANGADHWEIDEFTDRPLVLAELEIPHADAPVVFPDWLRPSLVREVTDEREYTNRSLAR